MPSPEPLTAAEREVVLAVARRSIRHGLEHGMPLPVRAEDYDERLRLPAATFVTLNADGRLRGCIGTLEARLPLIEDVALHAFEAAFRDPRFMPLTAEEYPGLEVHVSVLSPEEPIRFSDEPDLVRQLRPGVDGLVIAQGSRRATFLPSVWQNLPDPRDFLAQLKRKAGIAGPPGSSEPLKAWRYQTESFSDTG